MLDPKHIIAALAYAEDTHPNFYVTMSLLEDGVHIYVNDGEESAVQLLPYTEIEAFQGNLYIYAIDILVTELKE